MIVLFYAGGFFFFILYGVLWKKGMKSLAFPAMMAAFCAPLAAAWEGMEFSPSFTMQFLVMNLLLCILAEGIESVRMWRQMTGSGGAVFQRGLYIIGMLFAIPSVYIYAVGDDFLTQCRDFAWIGGMVFTIGLVLVRRKKKKEMVFGEILEVYLSISIGCFTMACGMRSPALLPYGIGILFLCAARIFHGMQSVRLSRQGHELQDVRKGTTYNTVKMICSPHGSFIRACLFWLGLLCASFFPVVPSL